MERCVRVRVKERERGCFPCALFGDRAFRAVMQERALRAAGEATRGKVCCVCYAGDKSKLFSLSYQLLTVTNTTHTHTHCRTAVKQARKVPVTPHQLAPFLVCCQEIVPPRGMLLTHMGAGA